VRREHPTGARYVIAQPRTEGAGDLAAAILPLGSVPYDNRSLPLVSPDGRTVATQTGAAPEWPTLLAAPGVSVPAATRVEVHAIDRDLGIASAVATVAEPVLLGRGSSAEGFLVESPRPDGARWIGIHPWGPGAIEWLVADGRVNAFASPGPEGRLAWSRRAVDAEHFDLVVRRGTAEWVIGAQGGDWLLPVFGADDVLHAIRVADGRLAVASMVARSPESMRETLTLLRVADQGTPMSAYQMMASQAATLGTPRRDVVHALFWHPGSHRMALWRPVTSPAAATLLEPGSVAACLDPSGLALVGTPEHLAVQEPSNTGTRRVLVPGPQVPRAVSDPDWPYLLLAPRADHIELTAFALIRR
jgi:hypothetical protein